MPPGRHSYLGSLFWPPLELRVSPSAVYGYIEETWTVEPFGNLFKKVQCTCTSIVSPRRMKLYYWAIRQATPFFIPSIVRSFRCKFPQLQSKHGPASATSASNADHPPRLLTKDRTDTRPLPLSASHSSRTVGTGATESGGYA